MTKKLVRFPLRLSVSENTKIDETILMMNIGKTSEERVSKQKFIMEAIFEKIKKCEGE